MDKRKLRAQMALRGDNDTSLARYLGIARCTFSAKMNENKREFTVQEITRIKKRYSLSAEELMAIFFDDEVSEKDTKPA